MSEHTVKLQDLAQAAVIVRDDPRFADQLANLRAIVRDGGGPELSTQDLLNSVLSLKADPVEFLGEPAAAVFGVRQTLEQIQDARRQLQATSQELAIWLDYLEYAISTEARLRRAIREDDPEPDQYKGPWLLRRLAEAVANFPPRDRWLGSVDDELVADRLRQILEELAQLRQSVEARKDA